MKLNKTARKVLLTVIDDKTDYLRLTNDDVQRKRAQLKEAESLAFTLARDIQNLKAALQ